MHAVSVRHGKVIRFSARTSIITVSGFTVVVVRLESRWKSGGRGVFRTVAGDSLLLGVGDESGDEMGLGHHCIGFIIEGNGCSGLSRGKLVNGGCCVVKGSMGLPRISRRVRYIFLEFFSVLLITTDYKKDNRKQLAIRCI